MEQIKLYPHQVEAINYLKQFDNCLIGDDMGLGKTFEGSEMLDNYNNKINLVVCQKSKVGDWLEHFNKYYNVKYLPLNLTNKKELDEFITYFNISNEFDFGFIGVINYDLLIRRPTLLELDDFTLLLDESSEIKNEHSKRGKFILKMKPKNVILLTGTPMNGKFEELWSQLKLLGWNISRDLFDKQYLDYKIDMSLGFPKKIKLGYKNKDRLLRKLHEYGGVFRKTDEVFTLPQTVHQPIYIEQSKEHIKYIKSHVLSINGELLLGDTPIVDRINQRKLCGMYSKEKLGAFKDLINSTNDRIIVFYNFIEELNQLEKLTDRPKSYVNGSIKDLSAYETEENSITFVQYQAGSMGLNLQKANRIIYFTPPDGNSIYFEQSQKRIHRIGQNRTCFYYYLVVKDSIEEKIYKNLDVKKEINFELFKKEGK